MDFHLLQGESRFKPSGRFPAEPVWQEYSSADSRAANRSDNVAAQWNILFLTARVTVTHQIILCLHFHVGESGNQAEGDTSSFAWLLCSAGASWHLLLIGAHFLHYDFFAGICIYIYILGVSYCLEQSVNNYHILEKCLYSASSCTVTRFYIQHTLLTCTCLNSAFCWRRWMQVLQSPRWQCTRSFDWRTWWSLRVCLIQKSACFCR